MAGNVDAQAEALRTLGVLKADRNLMSAALLDGDGYVRGAAALALTDTGAPELFAAAGRGVGTDGAVADGHRGGLAR